MAFGSIAQEPGAELAAAVTRRIEIRPRLPSSSRARAVPATAATMVPVREGGTHVPASVLVLDDSVTMRDARVMLYRRETGRLHASSASSRATWIAELSGFAGNQHLPLRRSAAEHPAPHSRETRRTHGMRCSRAICAAGCATASPTCSSKGTAGVALESQDTSCKGGFLITLYR